MLATITVLATALPAAAVTSSGTVSRVSDGDTYVVSLSGTATTVRMAGIQAMEVGDCHADAATARLRQLIDGKSVTVSAQSAGSTNRGRALRFTDRSGVDIGETLLDEGLVFAFPSADEPARNDKYLLASRVAAIQGIGVWDDDACGAGPYAGTPLDLVVKWDADGDDGANINGEWARITNGGTGTVSLSGWSLRDSALNIYTFPAGASIPAGDQLYVHIGQGTNTATRLYWGRTSPIFENEIGDGALLIDPHGDIRAHFFYPCVGHCTDPIASSLRISANADAAGDDKTNPNGEWVDVRNVGTETVDLGDYLIESWPYAKELRGSTLVHPGERLRLHVGSGTDSRLTRYWGKSAGILGNSGDKALLRSFDDRILVCTAWGTVSCPTVPSGPHAVSGSGGRQFDNWLVPAWTDNASHSFRDVSASYQQTPVGFLANNGVTNGTRPGYYEPEAPVTRGQMAAFLWRLAGSPRATTPHGFSDVSKSWQQEPVRWLKESGITGGVDATHFAPDRPVTRGQMGAFLWRLVDRPTGYGPHGFSDVNAGYQQDPVKWLKAVGITNGVTSTRFGTSDPVTRGQMAAFLHRLAQRL